jgi:hypothetical protein
MYVDPIAKLVMRIDIEEPIAPGRGDNACSTEVCWMRPGAAELLRNNRWSTRDVLFRNSVF